MTRIRQALLAATLLGGAGGGMAMAQQAPAAEPAAQPAAAQPGPAPGMVAGQLQTIKGRVAQYSLTPRGDADGVILADGTEVHLPPHLSAQLTAAVKPGDEVTVQGLRARAMPVVIAHSITDDASNQTVTDPGPGAGPGARDGGQMLEDQGKVKQQLHGPRGDVNGVLLEDGTIVRMPPPEARRLAGELAAGQTVYVRGDGVAGPLGRVIAARAIGPSQAEATEIAAPPPHGRRHGPHGGPDAPPRP